MRSEGNGAGRSQGDPVAEPPARASVLVLCVGSSLMGDDGVGLAVLERLRDGWTLDGAELVDGGTWGMNVLPAIESAERLLLVDAIRAGKEPGAVVRLDGDEIPRFFATKLSPHQIDLKEVLALAELRGTLPEVVALGVEPGRVELSTELSPEVEGALPELVRRAVAVLRGWGVAVGEAAPSRGAAPCTR